MTVTKREILSRLPEYTDQWQVVRQTQYVPDIVNEIVTAHRLFGSYYDCFSSLFWSDDVSEIADDLYHFCKANIRYREETVNRQTTALPTGILTRGYGDCKHYASFVGGVLASLNRKHKAGIKWWYCFAGYKPGAVEPYHVFVAVNDGREEIWIDPTPGSGATPTLFIKRSV